MVLEKKDAIKRNMKNFLSVNCKISIKVFAKKLVPVTVSVVESLQSSKFLDRFLYNNLHFMQYIVQRIGNRFGFNMDLISLNQLHTFKMIDLVRVLRELALILSGLIALMYSSIS